MAAALRGATSVLIGCHTRPDADTIGSGLALAMALESIGVDVTVSYPDEAPLPTPLAALPGASMLAPVEVVLAASSPHVAVAVDCASPGRLKGLWRALSSADTTVVIDHHATNSGFGNLNLIDAQANCTTELIVDVLDAAEITITSDIATCLYAGLVTDTGSFKWGNCAAHDIASRLIRCGVDHRGWTRRLLDTHPFAWTTLLGHVLKRATLVPEAFGGHGLVYTWVTSDDMDGLEWSESESIVDLLRTSAEADAAAVIKQHGPMTWSVSMRSRTVVNVADVALAFGGGGHPMAAGFSMTGDIGDVVARLLGVVHEH